MKRMLKRLSGVAFGVMLLCASAFGQSTSLTPGVKPSPEVATTTKADEAVMIKAEAEKSSRAFLSGDFNKVLDSTYPRIIELGGGKAKLIASMEAGMKEIRDLGLKIVSHTVGEPEKTVRAGTMLVAVVPTTLKMESTDTLFTQRSFWLAVSTDDGKTWTFLDGSYLNKESMKIVLPEAVDKITLPGVEQPVMERKPAG
ncbi:MAG TPA: hypothetical protein VF666_13965 [Pyrinomonadaceae bacterium]